MTYLEKNIQKKVGLENYVGHIICWVFHTMKEKEFGEHKLFSYQCDHKKVQVR
jgi:hypothetical protein